MEENISKGLFGLKRADVENYIADLRKDIIDNVIKSIIPENLLDSNTKIYVNPTGRFVVGGPQGDSGLTGRKIIVDTYGGYSRHSLTSDIRADRKDSKLGRRGGA